MKIKVESEKIVKAVKKLEGIEIVLENLNDAKEAVHLFWHAPACLKNTRKASLKMLRWPLFKNMRPPLWITR